MIYSELRRVLDPSYSDRELLRLANAIVIAHTAGGRLDDDNLTTQEGSDSFFSRPIDEAMIDGGWEVLDFETKRGIAIEDGIRIEFEDDPAAEVRTLISRLKNFRYMT
jgi:hypothetical protein